jgi:hypothetical protein
MAERTITTLLSPDGVPVLKERFRREIQVHGSGRHAQTLIQNDRIDECRLFVNPVLPGIGKRLFAEGVVPCACTPVRSLTNSKGVIHSMYRRGGKLRTGSFERTEKTPAGSQNPTGVEQRFPWNFR